ncbi:MAG: fatty acid--CoA ligase family protein [Pirellulaceae bacterium]
MSSGENLLIDELQNRYLGCDEPVLITQDSALRPSDVLQLDQELYDSIEPGDVVALIGDFEAKSIRRMLTILSKGCIYVPLTEDTKPQHEYFIQAAMVDVVVSGDGIERVRKERAVDQQLSVLRESGHAGLVLFSSGTTGQPKAILHDFEVFLNRFRTPRPTLRTLNFLLFDHIGGVNTLLHTLFNRGTVIFPRSRRVGDIINDLKQFEVELLPTTPTFLRMMLMSDFLESETLPSLKVVTYGTERMDEPSLKRLCDMLPQVDFRQTYGMSELGIMRVKSVSRDSLWMHVGGEGIETRIENEVLKIRAKNRMVGYLNAPSPFDDADWYDTKDLVEQREDGAIRIVGRTTEWINIGGEKVLPEVIETAALEHDEILHVKAYGAENPITGHHIELSYQLKAGSSLTKLQLKKFLKSQLPKNFVPHKLIEDVVEINHRFKKAG